MRKISNWQNFSFFFKTARWLFSWYVKLVFTCYTPLKVWGRHNIPSGAFLVCANHNSHMDTAALGTLFCKTLNDLGALSAKDYWHDRKCFNFFANLMFNLIPVNRRYSKDYQKLTFEETLRLCAEFLQDPNKRLVIYPEGTRSAAGEMGPFKDGIAYFAQALALPVLPVYLDGTFKAWGRDKIFMRPVKIRAIIGAPIYAQAFFSTSFSTSSSARRQKEQAKKMVKSLELTMQSLKEQLS